MRIYLDLPDVDSEYLIEEAKKQEKMIFLMVSKWPNLNHAKCQAALVDQADVERLQKYCRRLAKRRREP